MHLRVLGSNGTYPTPGRPASGYLVDHDGAVVLLDAGPGTFPVLQTHLPPAALDAIVLSHVHGDHCLDFFPLFSALRFGTPPPSPIPVLAPQGVAERIAGFAGAGPGHDLFRLFDFVVVGRGAEVRIGGLALGFGEAVHPVPAVVTAVAAAGKRMVYSGDTGWGGDLVEIARGASLLLCEATSQGAERRPYHLSAAEAGAAAQAAAVERLLVTHVAPGLDPGVSVAEAAEEYRGPVEWAAPGMEVMV